MSFSDCLTSLKAIQKSRHPKKGLIRKGLNPGNNIRDQLAVLDGGLFFFCALTFIGAAQQIIHGDIKLVGQLGEYRVRRQPFPGFPECNGALGNIHQLAEFFL